MTYFGGVNKASLSAESRPESESLALMPAGAAVEILAVAAGREAAGFLAASGLEPGAVVTVEATGAGAVLLSSERGPVHLTGDLAASVLGRRMGGTGA